MTDIPESTGSLAFLAGGGGCGQLIRSIDWSATSVGPVSEWSQALKTAVGIILHARQPMFLWWGDDLVQYYNDAYRPSLGEGKHPAAMGQKGEACWEEIWPIIWPQIKGVMVRGEPTWHEDQLVPISRNGRVEDVFWTYGYSPVYDDDGAIGGCLVLCTETTQRVVSQRRLAALQRLAVVNASATLTSTVLESAASLLAEPEVEDIAFALVYTRGGQTRLEHVAGISDDVAEGLDAHFRPQLEKLGRGGERVPLPEDVDVVCSSWEEPIEAAYVSSFGEKSSGGWIVYGLNPRLPFDNDYAEFLDQSSEQISVSHGRIEAFRGQAIVESERNSLLLQAPMASALMVGPEHVYVLANEPYIEMVGGRDIVGKSYAEAFPELRNTPLADALDEAFETGVAHRTDEILVSLDKAGDGNLEDVYFTFTLQPILRPSGEVYGMMAVAVDVTPQVSARKTLEANQAHHEQLVRELEAANRAKDEFLAMLGHELRNPLSPMVTAVELMKMRGVGDAEHERKIIERQLANVVTLVDDLLDVSRITRGVLQLDRSRVSVGAAARRALEQAGPLLEQRKHHVDVDVEEGLEVDGDESRLAQVIANLLTNAAKYTSPGGNIQLRATRENGDVVVIVRDDGIGIEEGKADELFAAFTREQRDPNTGGLGLGLAIVENLVAAHGGSVELRSEGTGEGTVAIVRLPVAAEDVQRADEAVRENQPLPTGRKILVVDDNEDAAEMIAMALREDGHEVDVAFDALAALDWASDSSVPDVALLDLGMPVVDGFELLRRLRDIDGWGGVRCIAVTGYGQDSDRSRTEAAGFDAHLVKPVNFHALRDHLED